MFLTDRRRRFEKVITCLQNVHTIVSCDDRDRVYHQADIWFQDGVIAGIGKLNGKADLIIDASDLILYPGLVNTHHHLYQYFTRNLSAVQSYELFDWLKALYEIWKNLTEETVLLSSLCGMTELMRYGCTTCFDHHYVFPKGSGDLMGAQFSAADMIGMRMHASRGSMDLSQKDGGLPPDSVVQTVEEIMQNCEDTVSRFHDPSEYAMHRVVLAPCSPFSVSKELLEQSALLARKLGVQLHTHLCETKDEEAYTLSRYRMRPYEYMESIGWTGSDVFYAHGIHFTDSELDRIAESGTKIAHCPCSNMKLSSGTMNIPGMMERDIPVGLGVDGSASNDASNLMEEIRTAYLLHRLRWGSKAPSGYQLLKMATSGGAKVLGRNDIGTLEPGKAADCFGIRRNSLDLVCAEEDPKDLFGTVGYHKPCDIVFVNGVCTVRDGLLTGIDEGRFLERTRDEIRRILR